MFCQRLDKEITSSECCALVAETREYSCIQICRNCESGKELIALCPFRPATKKKSVTMRELSITTGISYNTVWRAVNDFKNGKVPRTEKELQIQKAFDDMGLTCTAVVLSKPGRPRRK